MIALVLVLACTVCDSETGQQVRARIFGSEFVPTLAAVMSPFPVLLLVVGLLHFINSPRA
jgi:hypothetical protein